MLKRLFVLVCLGLCAPLTAAAQQSEGIGIRAQGMAGAFTAVADDASATWWNPSGLAGGAFGNVIVEASEVDVPRSDRDANGLAAPAAGSTGRGFAAAFPALGLSYYRLRLSEIQPQTSTAPTGAVRQDQGIASVYEQSLVLSQFGVTIGQSLGRYFVLGSTLKIVHGSLATDVQPATIASRAHADGLEGEGETHAGVDIGAMATFGSLRAGLMVRNANEITFGSGAQQVTLQRTYRIGGAYTTGTRGSIGTVTIAVDGDLTTTNDSPIGPERHLAVGGEVWPLNKKLGLRGGVNRNTIGDPRTSYSGGASVTVYSRTYLDGQYTGGNDEVRRGWGVDLRVTF